jgi:hypothetical protein
MLLKREQMQTFTHFQGSIDMICVCITFLLYVSDVPFQRSRRNGGPYLVTIDVENLWRENEGREAGSKHSEVMAERIEAGDGETTADGRNRRHPDGACGPRGEAGGTKWGCLR